MIVEVKMFTIDCDNCGKNAHEDGDFSCYNDKEGALEEAMESAGFIEEKGKHYCENCWQYDESDNIIIKKLN
jgi:hypothetical protein